MEYVNENNFLIHDYFCDHSMSNKLVYRKILVPCVNSTTLIAQK